MRCNVYHSPTGLIVEASIVQVVVLDPQQSGDFNYDHSDCKSGVSGLIQPPDAEDTDIDIEFIVNFSHERYGKLRRVKQCDVLPFGFCTAVELFHQYGRHVEGGGMVLSSHRYNKTSITNKEALVGLSSGVLCESRDSHRSHRQRRNSNSNENRTGSGFSVRTVSPFGRSGSITKRTNASSVSLSPNQTRRSSYINPDSSVPFLSDKSVRFSIFSSRRVSTNLSFGALERNTPSYTDTSYKEFTFPQSSLTDSSSSSTSSDVDTDEFPQSYGPLGYEDSLTSNADIHQKQRHSVSVKGQGDTNKNHLLLVLFPRFLKDDLYTVPISDGCYEKRDSCQKRQNQQHQYDTNKILHNLLSPPVRRERQTKHQSKCSSSRKIVPGSVLLDPTSMVLIAPVTCDGTAAQPSQPIQNTSDDRNSSYSHVSAINYEEDSTTKHPKEDPRACMGPSLSFFTTTPVASLLSDQIQTSNLRGWSSIKTLATLSNALRSLYASPSRDLSSAMFISPLSELLWQHQQGTSSSPSIDSINCSARKGIPITFATIPTCDREISGGVDNTVVIFDPIKKPVYISLFGGRELPRNHMNDDMFTNLRGPILSSLQGSAVTIFLHQLVLPQVTSTRGYARRGSVGQQSFIGHSQQYSAPPYIRLPDNEPIVLARIIGLLRAAASGTATMASDMVDNSHSKLYSVKNPLPSCVPYVTIVSLPMVEYIRQRRWFAFLKDYYKCETIATGQQRKAAKHIHYPRKYHQLVNTLTKKPNHTQNTLCNSLSSTEHPEISCTRPVTPRKEQSPTEYSRNNPSQHARSPHGLWNSRHHHPSRPKGSIVSLGPPEKHQTIYSNTQVNRGHKSRASVRVASLSNGMQTYRRIMCRTHVKKNVTDPVTVDEQSTTDDSDEDKAKPYHSSMNVPYSKILIDKHNQSLNHHLNTDLIPLSENTGVFSLPNMDEPTSSIGYFVDRCYPEAQDRWDDEKKRHRNMNITAPYNKNNDHSQRERTKNKSGIEFYPLPPSSYVSKSLTEVSHKSLHSDDVTSEMFKNCARTSLADQDVCIRRASLPTMSPIAHNSLPFLFFEAKGKPIDSLQLPLSLSRSRPTPPLRVGSEVLCRRRGFAVSTMSDTIVSDRVILEHQKEDMCINDCNENPYRRSNTTDPYSNLPSSILATDDGLQKGIVVGAMFDGTYTVRFSTSVEIRKARDKQRKQRRQARIAMYESMLQREQKQCGDQLRAIFTTRRREGPLFQDSLSTRRDLSASVFSVSASMLPEENFTSKQFTSLSDCSFNICGLDGSIHQKPSFFPPLETIKPLPSFDVLPNESTPSSGSIKSSSHLYPDNFRSNVSSPCSTPTKPLHHIPSGGTHSRQQIDPLAQDIYLAGERFIQQVMSFNCNKHKRGILSASQTVYDDRSYPSYPSTAVGMLEHTPLILSDGGMQAVRSAERVALEVEEIEEYLYHRIIDEEIGVLHGDCRLVSVDNADIAGVRDVVHVKIPISASSSAGPLLSAGNGYGANAGVRSMTGVNEVVYRAMIIGCLGRVSHSIYSSGGSHIGIDDITYGIQNNNIGLSPDMEAAINGTPISDADNEDDDETIELKIRSQYLFNTRQEEFERYRRKASRLQKVLVQSCCVPANRIFGDVAIASLRWQKLNEKFMKNYIAMLSAGIRMSDISSSFGLDYGCHPVSISERDEREKQMRRENNLIAAACSRTQGRYLISLFPETPSLSPTAGAGDTGVRDKRSVIPPESQLLFRSRPTAGILDTRGPFRFGGTAPAAVKEPSFNNNRHKKQPMEENELNMFPNKSIPNTMRSKGSEGCEGKLESNSDPANNSTAFKFKTMVPCKIYHDPTDNLTTQDNNKNGKGDQHCAVHDLINEHIPDFDGTPRGRLYRQEDVREGSWYLIAILGPKDNNVQFTDNGSVVGKHYIIHESEILYVKPKVGIDGLRDATELSLPTQLGAGAVYSLEESRLPLELSSLPLMGCDIGSDGNDGTLSSSTISSSSSDNMETFKSSGNRDGTEDSDLNAMPYQQSSESLFCLTNKMKEEDQNEDFLSGERSLGTCADRKGYKIAVKHRKRAILDMCRDSQLPLKEFSPTRNIHATGANTVNTAAEESTSIGHSRTLLHINRQYRQERRYRLQHIIPSYNDPDDYLLYLYSVFIDTTGRGYLTWNEVKDFFIHRATGGWGSSAPSRTAANCFALNRNMAKSIILKHLHHCYYIVRVLSLGSSRKTGGDAVRTSVGSAGPLTSTKTKSAAPKSSVQINSSAGVVLCLQGGRGQPVAEYGDLPINFGTFMLVWRHMEGIGGGDDI